MRDPIEKKNQKDRQGTQRQLSEEKARKHTNCALPRNSETTVREVRKTPSVLKVNTKWWRASRSWEKGMHDVGNVDIRAYPGKEERN